MSIADNWFPDDLGMRFPRTRAEIARENRAQHDIRIDATGAEYCIVCDKWLARLDEPCARTIHPSGHGSATI